MEEKRHVFSRRGILAGAGGLGGVVFLAACGAIPVAQTGEMADDKEPEPEAKEEMVMEEKIMRIDETFVESDGRYQAFRNTLKTAEEVLGIKTVVVPGEYSTIWERRQTKPRGRTSRRGPLHQPDKLVRLWRIERDFP